MHPHQKPPGTLRLGDKWLKFVGEGAANTIWAVHFVEDSGGDTFTRDLRPLCQGYLLRILKALSDGSDSHFTAKDQLAFFENTVLPAFGNQRSLFVDQKLVHLRQDVIDECNLLLTQMDENQKASTQDQPLPHPHLPSRTRKFVGTRVGPAGWHMLTEDMRPRGPLERFAEIKPKWLAQSPAAPSTALLCRNCAVATQRFTEAPEGQKPSKSDPAKYGCPLRLVAGPGPAPENHITHNGNGLPAQNGNGNGNHVSNGHAEKNGTNGSKKKDDDDWKAHAERIFRGQDPRDSHFLFWSIRQHHLLPHLRNLQNRLAGPGCADAFWASSRDDPDPDLLLSMTLRDCSLFFRYEARPHGALRMLDFKLADLDRKVAAKVPRWQDTERQLVEGGWYEGKQKQAQAGSGEMFLPRCYLREVQEAGSEPDFDAIPVDMTKLKDVSSLGLP
ncbi:hypothetical protein SODALDRAFT_340474 [Sodiomyces alkalinus F11]|uniref:Inositol-pentakisphosphate 2-kinase n=1 Tax=Sodiomyces alkalinus (strain CBS 110278 / VKM F-3762 / F11) TaxID=1314773 RepID=A0A3N2PUZ3_SODAK|nr:hypothetical protein SODALDRAFT_340474 [Sodiomyces alkalinus F11]ROT38323.1 hypothetical protein SODALDRAFT_340474 [Sodiomyces alkalinus F11]